MSHRTQDLPPINNPLLRLTRELRYHEASRQLLALILIGVLGVMGQPEIMGLYWVGVIMAVIGALVRLWSSGYVIKNKELATSGPYSMVRHPLYVGNILILVGFVLGGQALWMVVLIAAYFWFYFPTAIEYEDRKLHHFFGETWEQWSGKTRALIPHMPGKATFSHGWSLHKSLMKNGEPVIFVYTLFCLWLL